MTSVRRPGRLQKIAYDDTPLNTRAPDVDARIGWLLSMSRLHHQDPRMADGREFVVGLHEVGCSASRSLVSRWESGEIPVSFEGMSGYELALGFERGRISSIAGYLRVVTPGVKSRVARPPLDPSRRTFSVRLDELIELAEDGHATAREWQELGWYLASAPLVHLRAGTWERLAGDLVNRLARAVRVAYRSYSTAAVNLASVPRAQDFLTSAALEHLRQPGVQVKTAPTGLLGRLPTREAAGVVLDMIEDPPSGAVFSLAIWVAAQKLARGDFTTEERSRLDMLLLKMWRANPAKAADQLAELIACLPEGLRSTFTDAATKAGFRRLEYVVASGEELAPGLAAGISQDLAEGARTRVPGALTYGEDRMLVRLVREALFHRDLERRHGASMLLAASPFGGAVCDELLAMLATPNTPVLVRRRAAGTTRYLSGDAHRLRMLRFVEDRDRYVGATVTQAIGHMAFTDFSDQVLRSSLKEESTSRERAKMYALGMSGSPALETISRSSQAPEWQRTAARWWLSHGAALRE